MHHNDPQDRQLIQTLTRIVVVFWIVMKIISLKLWLIDRLYPVVPIIPLPSPVHVGLLGMFFLLSAWLLFKPESRVVMITLMITESISVLGDQNRLQPWEYQYLFIFLAIVGNREKPHRILHGIALMTVAMYLFSGLQKINPGFIHSVWMVHLCKRFFHLSDAVISTPFVRFSGLIIPAIEIIAAVSLLLPQKWMRIASYLLMAMHVFILWFLGPWGINYNTVVWPWNVQMMLVIYLLFIARPVRIRSTAILNSRTNMIIAFFWIIMPIVGMFGYWDKFLSAGMYSGKEKLSMFYFEDRARVPAELKPYTMFSHRDSTARLILTDWSVAELGVAAVAEPRIVRSIEQQINQRYAPKGYKLEIVEMRY